MAKIKFSNGVTVDFDGTPTEKDIEEISQKVSGVNGAQKTQDTGKTEGVFDAVKKGFQNVGNSIKEAGQGVADIQNKNISPLGKVVGTFGQMLRPFTQIGAEAVATPLRAGGEAIQNATGYDINSAVSDKLSKAVEAGLNTDTAKKIMSTYEGLKQTNPEAANAIESALHIADFATLGAGGAKAGELGAEGALKAGQKAVELGTEAGVKTAEAVGKTGKYVTGQAYGLKPETVSSIIKNPELFTPTEMAKIDRESIFTKAKDAIDKRIEGLSETGKGYDAIKSSGAKTNISEDTIKGILESKGIKVNEGKISVDLNSDIQLSNADAKGLEDVLSLVKGKKELNAKEVLNLRTRLSALSAFGEGKTDASKLVAKEIRKNIDNVAKEQIPGLAQLDAKYAPERQLLSKIKKTIFNSDGTLKDNAIQKIATLTGKGKEMALERMEKIVPGIKEDLNILKSIEDIEYAKGQKVGTYMRTGLGVGTGAVAGGPVGAIIGAIVTSPQVGVSLLRGYGKVKNISGDIINGIIGKMKSGAKLVGEEKKIMDEAVDNASKKMVERAKNVRPGMNIESIPNAVEQAIKSTEDRIRDLKSRGLSETSPQVKTLIKQLNDLRKK